jgi:hypothetical protein
MLSEPACPVGRAKSASGGEEGKWLTEDGIFVLIFNQNESKD